jgi:putative transposase
MSEYQIASQRNSDTPKRLAEFLQKEGQFLLPMVELVAQTETAIDELIDVTGRATIEAVLGLSAEEVAGVKHRGKAGGEIGWHGGQAGIVPLSDRKIRVRKPRLRSKDRGEVEVPAYARLQQQKGLAGQMLKIVLGGISTRRYREVLPRMAEAVGVSKSRVSREAIDASAQQLQELAERRFDEVDLLVLFIDGLRLGRYHVIAAVGVDTEGKKHVLGIKEGASENETVVRELLENLVARGVKPGRRRLLVIDGSQALRNAITAVYGNHNPVQRCRRHKERNVLGYLPKDEQRRVRRVLKNAWCLPAREGQAKLAKEAQRLEEEYPSAAASLREGLPEMFTVESSRSAADFVSRPVLDERHRIDLLWDPQSHPTGNALAERRDGLTLGGGSTAGNREGLSQTHGLSNDAFTQRAARRTAGMAEPPPVYRIEMMHASKP